MEEFNENLVVVEKKEKEFQAHYKGQFAAGHSREDAVNKVRKYYFDTLKSKDDINKLIINENNVSEKSSLHQNTSSFTWTGALAILSLMGLIVNVIFFLISIFDSDINTLLNLLYLLANVLIVLVLFELTRVVEKHE